MVRKGLHELAPASTRLAHATPFRGDPPLPGPDYLRGTYSLTHGLTHLVVLGGRAERDDELHDAEAPEDEQLAWWYRVRVRVGVGVGVGVRGWG